MKGQSAFNKKESHLEDTHIDIHNPIHNKHAEHRALAESPHFHAMVLE